MMATNSSPFKSNTKIPAQQQYRNPGRPVMSRNDRGNIGIMSILAPSQWTPGCLVCCNAPACCPLCSACPCCGDADYISLRRKASTYIYIRENSIEWNDPRIVMQPGVCCGVDPCLYEVQDQVTVLYYDDMLFDRISDQTRFCNEFLTCIFGGKGERIHFDSPMCCGACQRGSAPCICVPTCCTRSLCPCMLRHEIYVADAQKALYDINKAKTAAATHELFAWEESKDRTEL